MSAFPIKFPGAAEDIKALIIHRSTKTPGTFDISNVPTGGVVAAQSNPLDSKTKAIGQVKSWIARDEEGFRDSLLDDGKQRLTRHYPHFADLYSDLMAAKKGAKFISAGDPNIDLSGIGSILQTLQTLYSIAKVAGGL